MRDSARLARKWVSTGAAILLNTSNNAGVPVKMLVCFNAFDGTRWWLFDVPVTMDTSSLWNPASINNENNRLLFAGSRGVKARNSV